MKEIIVIVDRSAGNESVGEMWKETKAFNDDAKLSEVIKWVDDLTAKGSQRTNITLTVAHKEDSDF